MLSSDEIISILHEKMIFWNANSWYECTKEQIWPSAVWFLSARSSSRSHLPPAASWRRRFGRCPGGDTSAPSRNCRSPNSPESRIYTSHCTTNTHTTHAIIRKHAIWESTRSTDSLQLINSSCARIMQMKYDLLYDRRHWFEQHVNNAVSIETDAWAERAVNQTSETRQICK